MDDAKYAKKRPKKRKNRVFRILVLFLLLFVLVYFAAQNYYRFMPDNLGGLLEDSLTKSDGAGYPYEIPHNSVVQYGIYRSRPILLTESSLILLDGKAGEKVNRQHGFSKPSLLIGKDRYLLFDRENGKFIVGNKSKILLEQDMGGSISAGSIGESGNIALTAKGKNNVYEMVVLSRNFKETFRWTIPNQTIVDVALHKSGKKGAVATVTAEDGKLKSMVYVFDFSKEKPIQSVAFEEVMILHLEYKENRLLVTGDCQISVIDGEDVKTEYLAPAGHLEQYARQLGGKTAVLMSEYGNATIYQLIVFDKNGEKAFEIEFSEPIRSISCDRSNTAVLFSEKTVILNGKGQITNEISTLNVTAKVLVQGSHTYLVQFADIERIYTHKSEK